MCGGDPMQAASLTFPGQGLVCSICRGVGCCGPTSAAAAQPGTYAGPAGGWEKDIYTVDASNLDVVSSTLSAFMGQGEGASAQSPQEQTTLEQYHFIPSLDGRLKSSTTRDQYSATTNIGGTVWTQPILATLDVGINFDEATVNVPLSFTQPVSVSHTFTFRMDGVVREATDREGLRFASLSFDPHTTDMAGLSAAGVGTMGIDFWCVLRCGAFTILPVLISCVPAIFAGGPAGFIACVVARAGGAAAGVAACIARECFG